MKNKSIYIFELILFAFIVILKFIFIDKLPQYYELLIIIFFLGSLFIMNKLFGLKKDKTLVTNNATQITIIITMGYFLLSYLSGILLGFLRNSYSLTPMGILKNVGFLFIMIVSEELIRNMIANRSSKDKLPIIILTVLYILLDLALVFNFQSVNSGLKLFVFVSNIVLPIIARNALCTYLSMNVGYVPGLIYRLAVSVYIYILPIFPDLGYYISSVLGILVPYLIYIFISKLLTDSERKKISPIKKNMWYINIPLVICILFVVSLISGIFRYQIMAIGSGSMEPTYYRGDAVIFEKFNNEEKINGINGQILVFKHGGKYITHRIVDKITTEEGVVIYQTKGDNNAENDNFQVRSEDAVGIVKLRVKYIGLPSLWLQELLRR